MLFETLSVPLLLLIPPPAVPGVRVLVLPFSIVSPEMAAVMPLAIVNIRLHGSPITAGAPGPGPSMVRSVAISISLVRVTRLQRNEGRRRWCHQHRRWQLPHEANLFQSRRSL